MRDETKALQTVSRLDSSFSYLLLSIHFTSRRGTLSLFIPVAMSKEIFKN